MFCQQPAALPRMIALIAGVCLTATSTFGQTGQESNSLIEFARARGQQMKVEAKCESPSLLALRVRHELCPICRSIESDFDAIQSFADENRILILNVDLSNPTTVRQSSYLVAALGLTEFWPRDFSGLGSLTIIEPRSRSVVGAVHSDDVAIIEQALRSAVVKSNTETDDPTLSRDAGSPETEKPDAENPEERQTPGPGLQAGPTEEMRELEWMVGTWHAVVTRVGPDGQEVVAGEMESTIQSELDGCILLESLEFDAGQATKIKARSIRSFDRFRGVYRFIWLENMMGLADVFEGEKNDEGVVITTNLRSDTSLPSAADEFTHTRVSLVKESDDRFVISYESSTDKGKTWQDAGTLKYSRHEE